MKAGCHYVHNMHLRNNENVHKLKELVAETPRTMSDQRLEGHLNIIMDLVIKIETNTNRMVTVQNTALDAITARFNAIDSTCFTTGRRLKELEVRMKMENK